jgi:hypothetical protein
MEKAAGRCRNAGSASKLCVLAGAFTLCAAHATAWAQDASSAREAVLAHSKAEPGMRLDVQTSTLPRLDAQDSGFQAPRVDVSLFPSRPFTLGAVVGMSGFNARQAPQPFGLQAMRPSVDLGVRWSPRVQSQQIDVMAWRRMNNDDPLDLAQLRQPVYGARVELESGARISVKRKDGRPMIYYRTTF